MAAGLDFKQQITRAGQAYHANHRSALAGGLCGPPDARCSAWWRFTLARADYGPFVALGVIGLIFGVIAVVLLSIAFLRGGPAQQSSSAAPGAQAGRFSRCRRNGSGPYRQAGSDCRRTGRRAARRACSEHGSRKSVVGLLVVAGLGLIVGRRAIDFLLKPLAGGRSRRRPFWLRTRPT